MHPEALGGNVAEFDRAVRQGVCPFLNQLGETAMSEMRSAYEQVGNGDFDAIGKIAEQLAAAVKEKTETQSRRESTAWSESAEDIAPTTEPSSASKIAENTVDMRPTVATPLHEQAAEQTRATLVEFSAPADGIQTDVKVEAPMPRVEAAAVPRTASEFQTPSVVTQLEAVEAQHVQQTHERQMPVTMPEVDTQRTEEPTISPQSPERAQTKLIIPKAEVTHTVAVTSTEAVSSAIQAAIITEVTIGNLARNTETQTTVEPAHTVERIAHVEDEIITQEVPVTTAEITPAGESTFENIAQEQTPPQTVEAFAVLGTDDVDETYEDHSEIEAGTPVVSATELILPSAVDTDTARDTTDLGAVVEVDAAHDNPYEMAVDLPTLTNNQEDIIAPPTPIEYSPAPPTPDAYTESTTGFVEEGAEAESQSTEQPLTERLVIATIIEARGPLPLESIFEEAMTTKTLLAGDSTPPAPDIVVQTKTDTTSETKVLHEALQTIDNLKLEVSSATPEVTQIIVKLLSQLGHPTPWQAVEQYLETHTYTELVTNIEYLCRLGTSELGQDNRAFSATPLQTATDRMSRLGKTLCALLNIETHHLALAA